MHIQNRYSLLMSVTTPPTICLQKDLSRSARMASSFWWTGCSTARLILIFSWTAPLETHFCNFTTSNPSVDNSGKLWSLSIPQWLCKAKNLSIRSQACILKIVYFLHSWAIFHCRDCSYAKALLLLYLRLPSRFASGKSCTYCLWPRWDYPSRNADSGLVSGVSILCGTSVCGAGELQWQTVTWCNFAWSEGMHLDKLEIRKHC